MTSIARKFSDWYDALPYGEPSYLETFEAGHAAGRASRDAEVEALNAKLTYANEVIDQRNAEIKRGHEDFMQAITDPENQPSQFGTVTLAMYEAKEAEVEALRAHASTARTYMDGYSDGKQWALEEAAKICDSTPPHPFRPSIEAAWAIRKLGEGL